MDNQLTSAVEELFAAVGLADGSDATIVSAALAVAVSLALAAVSYFVTKRLVISGLTHWSRRSTAKWDDALIDRKVIHRAAYLAPLLVLYVLTPVALRGFDAAVEAVLASLLIAMVVVGVWVLTSVLNAVGDVYRLSGASRDFPIRGPLQAAKLVFALLGLILVAAIILGRSPVYLLTGLGAASAVLMLVFKDPILGFVAGIQLTTNRMVAPGDWIEMPKYNADGDVLEVGLTTVKVRNFDKTVTMIPTYALVSESFKNWRGMEESDGRRIKRAINIDIGSVRFCTDEMVERFGQIDLISEYIADKTSELAEANEQLEHDGLELVNARNLTNIGTFRAYVEAYLRQHPMINQDMTLLVRQLAPTEHGLPLQVYAFCRIKDWGRYESIQADIFDHLLAVVPEYDLKVFQEPTGYDFRQQ